MVDHVRKLLCNLDAPGCRRVSDAPSDAVLRLFGVDAAQTGQESQVRDAVDRVLPLAMAPDLQPFRRFFDQRVTPVARGSVYARQEDELSPEGLYGRVLSGDGRRLVSALFHADGREALSVLRGLRAAASSGDAPYALGAVLLACAYRRWILSAEGR